jgi:hypothetical protein
MTTQQIINYYANLLIMQYIGLPNAYATIKALVTPVIMNQLPIAVQNAFNLSTATGVQLDVLGKYVGVTRYGSGLDGSPIILDDADFLSFINIAIVKNGYSSSLFAIQTFLNIYFPGAMLVFDYQDMRMSYFLNSSIGSQHLAQIFVTSNILPIPMGVQIGSIIYSPNIFTLFGFRTYGLPGYNISPFNTYASYQTDFPWLTYKNALVA